MHQAQDADQGRAPTDDIGVAALLAAAVGLLPRVLLRTLPHQGHGPTRLSLGAGQVPVHRGLPRHGFRIWEHSGQPLLPAHGSCAQVRMKPLSEVATEYIDDALCQLM